MSKLILIRHAKVRIDPETKSHDWKLVPEQEQSIKNLAAQLEKYQIHQLFCSTENKAKATAEVLSIHRKNLRLR